MKLLFFDDYQLGVLNGDMVVDASHLALDFTHVGPQDLVSGLIARFDDYRERLAAMAANGRGLPISEVRIRSPLPRPANLVCMAVNYVEGRAEPVAINAFLKSPTAVIGHDETIMLPDVPATIFEAEAELAVVIGKRARNVDAADAMSHVFGYAAFLDGSARGLQPERNGFYQMKSHETFAPIGPFLVTADEIPEPQNLRVRLWNDGELMQDFNTSDMANSIGRCLEFVSSIHPLEPGDVIATGTDHRGLHPVQDQNLVELEIEGLGRLRVRVRDDLHRTWARESRLTRHEKGLPGTTPQLTGKYAHGTDAHGEMTALLGRASSTSVPTQGFKTRKGTATK